MPIAKIVIHVNDWPLAITKLTSQAMNVTRRCQRGRLEIVSSFKIEAVDHVQNEHAWTIT